MSATPDGCVAICIQSVNLCPASAWLTCVSIGVEETGRGDSGQKSFGSRPVSLEDEAVIEVSYKGMF